MNLIRAVGLGAVVFATSLIVLGEDWRQWRGPHHDNVSRETGLVKSWPAAGPTLKHKITGAGAGYSSVSVAGGQVITIGDKGASSFVIAFNEKDGKKLWEAKLDKSGAVGWGDYDGPRSTPSIDGDLVFAISQFGDFVCYEKGVEKWRKNMRADFGSVRPEWGYAESPLVDGDKVLCSPGGPKGAVVALDKKSGKLLWQSSEFTDAAQYATLVPAEIGGVKQYIQLTMESVAGVRATDGKLLWKAPRKGSTAVIPTPVYHDNHVFVASGYGTGCNLFKITMDSGKFTAQEVYSNRKMKNHLGGVVLVEGFVYGSSDPGILTCLDLKTGKAVWESREPGKGSVLAYEGRIIARREDGAGTVTLVEADPKEYKEVAKFNPPDRSDKNSWAPPVIANKCLYLRDQDNILVYDLAEKK